MLTQEEIKAALTATFFGSGSSWGDSLDDL